MENNKEIVEDMEQDDLVKPTNSDCVRASLMVQKVVKYRLGVDNKCSSKQTERIRTPKAGKCLLLVCMKEKLHQDRRLFVGVFFNGARRKDKKAVVFQHF